MNDQIAAAIGRQIIELCLQRDDLIRQLQVAQAELAQLKTQPKEA